MSLAGRWSTSDRMSAWTYRRQSAGKAAAKIVPLHPRTPCWKGLCADSEEKREPVSDINTAIVDSLKALDSKRPIREADIPFGSPSPKESSHCLPQAGVKSGRPWRAFVSGNEGKMITFQLINRR